MSYASDLQSTAESYLDGKSEKLKSSNITIRIGDDLKLSLKAIAKKKKISLAEACRIGLEFWGDSLKGKHK